MSVRFPDERLKTAPVPCRYEYDDALSIYSRRFLVVDAPYANRALQSILLTVQNSRSGGQDTDTAPRLVAAEQRSAAVRPEKPVSEPAKESVITLPSELPPAGPVSETPKKSVISLPSELPHAGPVPEPPKEPVITLPSELPPAEPVPESPKESVISLPSELPPAGPVPESPKEPVITLPSDLPHAHAEDASREHAAESFRAGDEPATAAVSVDPENGHTTAAEVVPAEARPALTGKVIKMLVCEDLRLGAVSAERLDMKQSRTWQAARNEKYADLIDKASQNNAAYIALWGRIFGQERVSESVIDTLFGAIREEPSIDVLAFLDANEHKRISYRNDIPENLHLINVQAQDSYLDERIALRVKDNAVELQLGDNDAVIISRDNTGHYVLSGIPGSGVIPSFEPTGFEDAQDAHCGYGIVEWTEDKPGQFRVIRGSRYAFKAVELKILPGDDEKEILGKINNLIRPMERDTFLRVTLTGRSAFGLTMSSDALKSQLQNKVFFAEVYDNTVMDIDEEAFETDISLRSEFVRLALQDGSLSESERSRVISLGWNALSGREVSAE